MSTTHNPQEGTRLIPGIDRPVPDCARLAPVLSLLGDKWTILVIVLLEDRTKRFNELRRDIGHISQRMLTLTLRALERHGLVKRTKIKTVPPQVEYELTSLGRSLHEPMKALADWIADNVTTIETERLSFDASKD